MTITEVGKKYELSIDTLRYYERIGLLPPAQRFVNLAKERDVTAWLQRLGMVR